MDGAPSVCSRGAGGGSCFYHNWARGTGFDRIDDCGARLANDVRHYRKRPVDRNRSDLRVALRAGDDLLAELVGGGTITVADLGSALDLARFGLAGKGSG